MGPLIKTDMIYIEVWLCRKQMTLTGILQTDMAWKKLGKLQKWLCWTMRLSHYLKRGNANPFYS